MRQQKRPRAIVMALEEVYWQLAIFPKNGKLEKMARVHQRFCKTSNEVTKREILTNGDYKKMTNFWRKSEISAKMGSIPKSQKVASSQMAILRK